MAEASAISWTDDTFNGWWGCMRVGPGCDNCYAAALSHRYGDAKFGGPGEGVGTRVLRKDATWNKPLKWNKEAANWKRPRFVFCSSMADVFDNQVPIEWVRRLFALIRKTPNLTWLLLTKRPQNILKIFADACPGEEWPANAAIGCTVVNQDEANRDVPILLEAAAKLKPAFTFLSLEPLLGKIDLTSISTLRYRGAEYLNALTGTTRGMFGDYCSITLPKIDWVIVGGESGAKARVMLQSWAETIWDQCKRFGTAFHLKQWGEWAFAGKTILEKRDKEGRTGVSIVPIDKKRVIVFGNEQLVGDHVPVYERVGVKQAGRLLKGREHNARPMPRDWRKAA